MNFLGTCTCTDEIMVSTVRLTMMSVHPSLAAMEEIAL